MALTFNGTSQYITRGSAVLTAYPFTFSAWYNPVNNTGGQSIISIGSSTGGVINYWEMGSNAGPLRFRTVSSGTSNNVLSVASFTTGSWNHCAVVGVSATSRLCYLNNVSASGTVNLTPSSLNQTVIGGLEGSGNTTITDFAPGTIAWPAIWNIALSASEISALFGGLHPLRMHPEALVSCPQLNGNSPEIDLVSSTTWTTAASPTLAANPSIYMPRGAMAFTPSALSATSTFNPETILTLSAQMAQRPSLSMSPETILVEQQQVLDNATLTVSPETILTLGPSIFTPTIFATVNFNPGNLLTLNANDFVTAIINQYLIFPPGNINESHLQQ